MRTILGKRDWSSIVPRAIIFAARRMAKRGGHYDKSPEQLVYDVIKDVTEGRHAHPHSGKESIFAFLCVEIDIAVTAAQRKAKSG